MMPWGSRYNATTLETITSYFRRNEILTFGMLPDWGRPCSRYPIGDLPRCIVERNGGAFIPITTATQAEVTSAMLRIVDAVAGATSRYRLTRSPITSTLRVRVRGVEVPRSRSNGFDYDFAQRSIVFYGATYRPARGDEVVVSYRVWQGSPG
jgi:hypothetical protein